MTNPFETPQEVTEQEIIEALNAKGIEDTGTVELLAKFVNQCQAEANAEAAADPENPEVTNRANIEADIKIARMYLKTERYKEQASQSLRDSRVAAFQTDSTQDLIEEIDALIDELNSEDI